MKLYIDVFKHLIELGNSSVDLIPVAS